MSAGHIADELVKEIRCQILESLIQCQVAMLRENTDIDEAHAHASEVVRLIAQIIRISESPAPIGGAA